MIENLMNFIDALPAWVTALTALVTACAGIATLTPTKSDDEAINKILRLINIIGLNVGKAKNEDDK